MQKVSLVRCGPPFWMALRPQTLRPPQGWPLPELWPTSHRIFVCHRAEGRHWFEEALVAALAHQVMPTHVLQSRVLITCSHCSSGSCCLPVVPLPREPRLACQQRCGVYSQAGTSRAWPTETSTFQGDERNTEMGKSLLVACLHTCHAVLQSQSLIIGPIKMSFSSCY